jgi:hypothetical protein
MTTSQLTNTACYIDMVLFVSCLHLQHALRTTVSPSTLVVNKNETARSCVIKPVGDDQDHSKAITWFHNRDLESTMWPLTQINLTLLQWFKYALSFWDPLLKSWRYIWRLSIVFTLLISVIQSVLTPQMSVVITLTLHVWCGCNSIYYNHDRNVLHSNQGTFQKEVGPGPRLMVTHAVCTAE